MEPVALLKSLWTYTSLVGELYPDIRYNLDIASLYLVYKRRADSGLCL